MITFLSRSPSGEVSPSVLSPLKFPDGAVHVNGADWDEALTNFGTQIAYVQGFSNDDMFTLAMWGSACDSRGERKIIVLPYLPGARMDRGAVEGSAVYAWFLMNDVNPSQIITLDPHSERATSLYTYRESYKEDFTFSVFPVERIIRKAVQDASRDIPGNADYVGVIAPDAGARDRAQAAATVMGVPVYTAGKSRDFATGKLSGFHMVDELPAKGTLLVVDDLCDGGGTFNGLAQATGLPKERLDLWVTHGIFSKGVEELLENFGVIHTTDSYFDPVGTVQGAPGLDWPIGTRIIVHKVAPYLLGELK